MIDKKSFLETVKNFSREDFREYLYRDINKKRKLLTIVIKVDDADKDYYLNLIKNNLGGN